MNYTAMCRSFAVMFVLMLIYQVSSAQKEFQKSTKKTEVGTDIISLMNRVVQFGTSQYSTPYSPTYQLSIKRHEKWFSIRAMFGGYSNHTDIMDLVANEEELTRSNSVYHVRTGLERQVEVGKRIRAYYGLDYRFDLNQFHTDASHWNGGFRHSSEAKTTTHGISPIGGIEFYLTERICLQTEFRMSYYRFKTIQETISIPIMENPPEQFRQDSKQELTGGGTSIAVPNFLNIVARF